MMQVKFHRVLGSPTDQTGVRCRFSVDRNLGCLSLPDSKQQTYNLRATHRTESGRAR
jgi:hypothetical protein